MARSSARPGRRGGASPPARPARLPPPESLTTPAAPSDKFADRNAALGRLPRRPACSPGSCRARPPANSRLDPLGGGAPGPARFPTRRGSFFRHSGAGGVSSCPPLAQSSTAADRGNKPGNTARTRGSPAGRTPPSEPARPGSARRAGGAGGSPSWPAPLRLRAPASPSPGPELAAPAPRRAGQSDGPANWPPKSRRLGRPN